MHISDQWQVFLWPPARLDSCRKRRIAYFNRGVWCSDSVMFDCIKGQEFEVVKYGHCNRRLQYTCMTSTIETQKATVRPLASWVFPDRIGIREPDHLLELSSMQQRLGCSSMGMDSESYLQPKECKRFLPIRGLARIVGSSTCITSLAKLGSYYPVPTIDPTGAAVL